MPRKSLSTRKTAAKPATARRPAILSLRSLRESLEKTQGDVARAAGMTQPQLSRVERRRDHLVSTLRRYVQAMGGDVEIVAHVDGRHVVLRDI